MTERPLETECDSCRGRGRTMAPIWDSWLDDWDVAYRGADDNEDGSAIAADKEAGPRPRAPVWVECHACAGRGAILTTDGRSLAGTLTRQLLPSFVKAAVRGMREEMERQAKGVGT